MTQPGTPQLQALTGLRGVAAWLVVLYHYRLALWPYVPEPVYAVVSHGALAVDLFFVMSGFIIALNYSDEFLEVATASDTARTYGRFLLLRIARIYPLHVVMLALFVSYQGAVSIVHGQSEFQDLDYLARSVVLIQAWPPASEPMWNVPAWSISTEMFAYLLFPAMAWIAGRSGRSLILAWLGALLLVLALVAPFYQGLTWDIARFGLPRCVLEFAAGVMVQRLWELARPTPRQALACLGVGTLLIAALAADLASDGLVMPAAFCCFVYGLSVPGTWPAGLLSRRVPILLGTLSYATYLSHDLIKFVVKFLFERPGVPLWIPLSAYVALVLACSWLLFKLVEVPGRRWLRRAAYRLIAVPRESMQ